MCSDCKPPATGPIPDYLIAIPCLSCGSTLSLDKVGKRRIIVDAIPHRGGHPDLAVNLGPACSVDGCGRGLKANGLCVNHYMRERRAGQRACLDAVKSLDF